MLPAADHAGSAAHLTETGTLDLAPCGTRSLSSQA
jgi:hypothetical protein